MKLVALTSAALLAATTAFAGSLNTETDAGADVAVVETTPAPLAGSGVWLVPAIAIALIAAVVLSKDDKK